MKFNTRMWSATRATIAVVAGAALVLTIPTVVAADPIVSSISGTVTLDTNADGVVGSATQLGYTEPGMPGVQVDIVCVATGTSILQTTSDASGAWSFTNVDLGDAATSCPDGIVQIVSTVTDDRYSITDAAGENQTPRTANEQIGLSAPMALAAGSDTVVNTLTRPDWYLDLTLANDAALGGPAVYTGTAIFDTVCPEAGHDCAIDDDVVRTADTVTFTWAVAASSLDDLADTLDAVVLEQTLELTGGAIANFARIPARCKPAGGGGATPASVIVDQDGTVIPEGQMPPAGTTSVTLRCNLGDWTQTGDAVTIQPVVKISADSPNGSEFTTVARAFAVDPAAPTVPTAVPTVDYTYGPIEITAAPAYELEKKGFFGQYEATVDIGRGPEAGYMTYSVIQIKTNRRVGVEALEQPTTITEDVFSFLGDGVTPNPGFEFAITECFPNPSGWGGTVGGMPAPYGDWWSLEQTVLDSGNCAIDRNTPGDLTSDYTLTFDDIDLSGARYPTKNAEGADLTAGPFYVASFRVGIFIPYASIEATDGDPDNRNGALTMYNRIGDFDPDGISGTSNFGSGREPGYCEPESVDGTPLTEPGMPECDPTGTNTPTTDKSDNVIGPNSFQFLPPGVGFAKYLLDHTQLYSPSWGLYPGMGAPHDGQAQMQPGQTVDTHLDFYVSQGDVVGHNAVTCDIFDNSMAVLVPSEETVTDGTDDIWAWLSPDNMTPAAAADWNSKWIFEYAHIDVGSDDPLAGGFDSTSGRYLGDWTNQAAARCDDDAPEDGWFTNPNSVPGGIDEVNAIRVRPGIDPTTGELTVIPFRFNNRLDFGVRLRTDFHGGPNDGQLVPAGAVFANFGAIRFDELNGGAWSARGYSPSPENTLGDGDRVTISRATLALQKQTITVDGIGDGAAPVGTTGSAVAGNPIVWEVLASVNATSDEPAPIDNLQIVDILPDNADYDPDCTSSITGGTPADVVQYDTPAPGQTTLTWNLGQWMPNTAVPARRICTISDPLAPQGTQLVNFAQVKYEGSPTQPSDTHTVVLEQTGEVKLRKTVDAPLDVLNDDQVYSLSLQNFSETLTVGAPTIIEVFPFNGDATPLGGVNRSPSSDFQGSLELTGAVIVENMAGGSYAGTVYYTTDDPATVHQDLNHDTATWVTEGALGGDFSQVTAIKFVGDDDLTPFGTPATSGVTLQFTLQAGDTGDPFSGDANTAGDRYSNRFTAFSSTFQAAGGAFQILASNRTVVRTLSHSSGDLVFEDRDGDGLYTASRDRLVPDGVTVELYFEGDGGDELVASTTTTAGVYLFTSLPPGRYHVGIPASEFGAGGLLEGYTITRAPASGTTGAEVDQNDDLSHDAIIGAGGSIRSNSFTLSSTVDPVTHSVSGDEPTGENIHGVVDPTTTDPFSNLAIDLALQQQPGIDIEKEVCTIADNSCDPTAALGEGGWSVDGVPGVGPSTETTERPYGSAVLWRIIVTNTGEQYLTDVAVTDFVTPDCAATDADVPDFADFEPGDVETYTCETASIVANITPNTATVVGTPQGGEETLTDADTANATTVGSLVINKLITGPGVETFGAGPFDFEVECTLGGEVVYDGILTLTPTEGSTAVTSTPITGLPLGAECVVTETDNGGADATPAPVTVTIVDNDQSNTVIAELTNHFSRGYLSLTKELEGTASDDEYVAGLEFDILVTCQVESADGTGAPIIATVYSGTLTVIGGQTVEIVDADGNPVPLPIGTHCFAEETDDGGATDVVIEHDSYDTAIIVGSDDVDQQLVITATNVFDYAEIAVQKVVVGSGPAGPYTFEVQCTIDGEPYVLPDADARFELSHGQSRIIRVLVGVECAVVETDVPDGVTVIITDTDGGTAGGDTDGVVVANEDLEIVTVTNRLPLLASELGRTGLDVNLVTPIVGGGILLLLGGGLFVLEFLRRRKAVPRG